MPRPGEPRGRRTAEARVTVLPSGLPRTGMVYENPAGDGLIVRNTHSPELQEAFARQLPLDLDRDDRRTLAQIATTAFAAYNNYDFHRGAEQFNTLVAVARADNGFAERIGRQYDRIAALGDNLPYLNEPAPNGGTVRMDRNRFIDVVGATTLLTVLHHGTGETNPGMHADQIRVLQTAIDDPTRRAGAMHRLDDQWGESFVTTNPAVIDTPHEYIAALCAKAIGPTHFRENYNEVLDAAMGDRAITTRRVTVATAPPVIDSRPPRDPAAATPERTATPNNKLNKKLGGLIYESKARKEENNVIIKGILLVGETFTDVTLAYANLRMFSHLNKIAQHLDNTLMDQDKRGFLNSISNLSRKATVMGAVYAYCDTKFQAERAGIRNNHANGWKLMGTLAASNIALDIVESHFVKKGLPLEELFTMPIAPYFYNLRPDLKGWRSIGKVFTIAEGTHRLGLVNGFHKVQPITREEANKRTWEDIKKSAGTVRDLLDKLDDGFTIWSVGSAVIEHVIPDQVKTNWFAGRALRILDNAFEKWSESAEDVSDLAEIPEVMAGLVESYAQLVTESFAGGTGLTGSQSQIITEAIRRYVENNDSDNDYVVRVANRFLRKLGIPGITPTPTTTTGGGAGAPARTRGVRTPATTVGAAAATRTPTPTEPAPAVDTMGGGGDGVELPDLMTPDEENSILENVAQFILNGRGISRDEVIAEFQGIVPDFLIERALDEAGLND